MRPSPAPAARRAGSTRVELRTCVVIVGLPAAFAVPRFSNAAGGATPTPEGVIACR